MDTIEVDGLRIGYQRVGNGPPLVLLHGYVGDGPTTWRPQVQAFSDDFTVVAWDAPGADTHNEALRALANRLVGILHGCLSHSTLYDEHTAWGHRTDIAA